MDGCLSPAYHFPSSASTLCRHKWLDNSLVDLSTREMLYFSKKKKKLKFISTN
jgi:hypothetical protein